MLTYLLVKKAISRGIFYINTFKNIYKITYNKFAYYINIYYLCAQITKYMKVLIINGHPTMETSNANKAILEEVKQNYPFTDFLNIHRQTANHCKLLFQEPVISYGMKYIPEVMPKEAFTTLQQRAKEHAAQLVAKIKELN